MNPPKFTVVTPTYNQGAFIEKTIDSVLSQGYPNLEYIIIDGGSKDSTVEIIKKYERHLAYWVSEPDRGQSHAINKGMGRASGQYLTWLNSDDWYLPDTVHEFVELFRSNPNAGVVVGTGQKVDENNNVVYRKEPNTPLTVDTLYGWLSGGNFMQPSSAFTSDAWAQCGPLDENEHIAMDLDFWLRLAIAGYTFAVTDKLLSIALAHSEAKTTAFLGRMRAEAMLVVFKHGGKEALMNDLPRLGQALDNVINRLQWYENNHQVMSNHPIMKKIYPLIKRLSKEGEYWQMNVPPWVK